MKVDEKMLLSKNVYKITYGIMTCVCIMSFYVYLHLFVRLSDEGLR